MPLPISHIGLLTHGNYAENDPLPGLEQTLPQLAYGEILGFDSPGSASVISRRDFLGAALLAALSAFFSPFPALKNSRLTPYFLAGAHGVSFVVPQRLQQQISIGMAQIRR